VVGQHPGKVGDDQHEGDRGDEPALDAVLGVGCAPSRSAAFIPGTGLAMLSGTPRKSEDGRHHARPPQRPEQGSAARHDGIFFLHGIEPAWGGVVNWRRFRMGSA
jgi:hypothetical protein